VSRPASRRSSRLVRIGLVAASAALGLGALEGALRLGWIPNREYERARPSGDPTAARRRLLILGDSFLIEDLGLAPVLRSGLAPYGVSVLNLAQGGTGPFEYLDAMRGAGAAFRPDVVLLGYYAGNDLTDVENHPRFAVNVGGGRGATGVAIHTGDSWRERSYLYQSIRRLAQPWLVRYLHIDYGAAAAAGVAPELLDDARKLRINPWLVELAVRDREHLLENVLMETPGDEAAFGKVTELLTEVDEACRALGAQLVLVVFPATIQVDRSHFEFFRELTFDVDERTLDSTRPQDRLAELARQRGVEILDLLPLMKAHASEAPYRDKDDHFSARGNELAARQMLDFLLAKAAIGQETGGADGTGSGHPIADPSR